MTETLTFGDLLRRLSEEGLSERCAFCHTFHPHYLLTSYLGERETFQVPGLLALLEGTDEENRDLATLVEFDGATLSDPDTHQPYASVSEQVYTCGEKIARQTLAYEEAMKRSDPELVQQMKLFLARLSAGDEEDDETADLSDLKDDLRACCHVEWVNVLNGKKDEEEDDEQGIPQRECGSARVLDTPKSLYRLLYLFRPSPLSFADMYKGCLLILSTPDGRFSVAVHFFQYELALYFWAESALVRDKQADHPFRVRAGAPGADNGLSIQHEEGLLFFQMIKCALEYVWPAYPGNDFAV